MIIGLVSCTKSKLPYPAPARDLYSPSGLFRGAMGALQGHADVVYVLSAKYGLLPLDQVIAPYDLTLNHASPRERQVWAEQVLSALVERHGPSLAGITFEFHTGMAYRQPLEELLRAAGAICTCPVEGLSMGQRLGYYAGTLKPVVPRVEAAAAQFVAPSDLHGVLAGLQGRTLATGTGAPFLVTEVSDSRVVVVPESTQKPRPVSWAELEGAWYALRARGSITLAEVREVASEANPAYVFALLAEVPDVRLERGRPMRLVHIGG